LDVPLGDDRAAVRVLYLRTVETSARNEIATAVRALAEIRGLFAWNGRGAILMRGLPPQLDLTTWAIQVLDADPPPRPTEFRREREADLTEMRVWYVPGLSRQAIFALSTTLRRQFREPRVCAVPPKNMILVRSTEELLDRMREYLRALAPVQAP
jgi:hypothetical protein